MSWMWISMKCLIRCYVFKSNEEIFDGIATGKTYGYEADSAPSWEEALEPWKEHGVENVKNKSKSEGVMSNDCKF